MGSCEWICPIPSSLSMLQEELKNAKWDETKSLLLRLLARFSWYDNINEFSNALDEIVLRFKNLWKKYIIKSESRKSLLYKIQLTWLFNKLMKTTNMTHTSLITIVDGKLQKEFELWHNRDITNSNLIKQIEDAKNSWENYFSCPSESDPTKDWWWWVDWIFVFRNSLGEVVWYLLLDKEDEVYELEENVLKNIYATFYEKIHEIMSEILLVASKNQLNLYKKDPLTNMLTRRSWFEEIDRTLNTMLRTYKQWNNLKCCVILSDIDKFKQVNDEIWHDVWDLVIKWTAKVMLDSAHRDTDFCIRWWWEELIAVLPHTELNWWMNVCNNIRNGMRKVSYSDNKWWNFSKTASIWIMEFDGKYLSEIIDKIKEELNKLWVKPEMKSIIESAFEIMLKQADLAMYTAKKTWRDRIINFYEMGKAVLDYIETAKDKNEIIELEKHLENIRSKTIWIKCQWHELTLTIN